MSIILMIHFYLKSYISRNLELNRGLRIENGKDNENTLVEVHFRV